MRTLNNPPYLQVALDTPDIEAVKKVVSKLPESDRIIIEAGTPLIKRYGSDVISKLRETRSDSFIVADLKTLDVGALEVRIAQEGGADAAVVSGLAFPLTIKEFIKEAKRRSIYSFIDMMNVSDPLKALKDAGASPTAVLLHRGIDSEAVAKHSWDYLKEVKEKLAGKALIGVGGGIELELAKKSIENGADIVIVGRYITNSPDVAAAANSILKLMR
ncbi:orotidine 5'-phosphate decarboxylase [Candidatus Micrarchaeota archaeon]|nr:orotidine 5'-phosphate decarboxylase [Candidatus Micrarchaeota archaeon]